MSNRHYNHERDQVMAMSRKDDKIYKTKSSYHTYGGEYSYWRECTLDRWDNLSTANREILYFGEQGIKFVERVSNAVYKGKGI